MAKVILHRRNAVRENFAFGAQCAAQIDINDADFTGNVPGYPLLINIDSSSSLTNLILDADGGCPALNGGGDLRVVTDPNDEGSRLAIDVVTLITNNNPALGEMEIYLEAETVLASGGKTIYLLWGIPAASQPARDAAFGSERVWDQPGGADWKLISHLNDVTTSTVNDESPNDIALTKVAANTPIESTLTPFSSSLSQDFHNDQNDYITTPITSVLDLGANFTVMFWARTFETPDSFMRMLSRKVNFPDTNNWEISVISGNNTNFEVLGSSGSAAVFTLPGGGTWSSGDWHHISITFQGSNAIAIVDGVTLSTGTIASVVDVTHSLRFGWNVSGNQPSWDGNLDEIRILDGSFANNAVVAMYKGMNDPANHVTVTIL